MIRKWANEPDLHDTRIAINYYSTIASMKSKDATQVPGISPVARCPTEIIAEGEVKIREPQQLSIFKEIITMLLP